jgi:hypothetical protein
MRDHRRSRIEGPTGKTPDDDNKMYGRSDESVAAFFGLNGYIAVQTAKLVYSVGILAKRTAVDLYTVLQ